MKARVWLEFELAYYDSAVRHFNHYTKRTPQKVIYDGRKVFVVLEYQTLHLKTSTLKAELCPWYRTLYYQNMFVISVVVSVYLKLVSYDNKQSQVNFTQVSLQQPKGKLCLFCDKVCGCMADLRSHIRMHKDNADDKDSHLVLSLMQQGLKKWTWLCSHQFF